MTGKINTEMVLSRLTNEPKTNTQIADELEVARSSPKRHLDRLAQEGKAVKTPAGWIKGKGSRRRRNNAVQRSEIQRYVYDLLGVERDCECQLLGIDIVNDAAAHQHQAILDCIAELVSGCCDVVDVTQRLEAHKKANDWINAYYDFLIAMEA